MMRKRIAVISGLCLSLGLLATQASCQQDKSKRPSPPAQAQCDLGGGTTVSVDYSSPRAKGRRVFGGLVPYGEVWRAGANEATTFVTTGELKVGGKGVPAGHYTIFTIPEEKKWTLIISKKTGEWGIPYPGENFDFVRTEMRVSNVPEHVEDFAIAFEKSGNGCKLDMTWENTRASVDIERK
jgi:hypothetical protein